MRLPLLVAFTVAGSALLAATSARPARADAIAAQALFDAGEKLMSEKRFDEACAKFSASMDQDRAVGTHYALADCHERAGRIATAWEHYLEIQAEATAQNRPDRAAYVKDRAEKLAPRLMKVIITLSPAAQGAGATVKRDGKTLEAAQLGIPVPVDPGQHVVTATADGKKDWKATVDATKESETYSVEVPKLEDAPKAPPPSSKGASPWKTVGWVLGGAGVVGLAVGATFGIVAMARKNGANCDANNLCDPGAASDIKTTSLVSDVGWIAGGVLLAGGVALVLLAPKAERQSGLGVKSVKVVPTVIASGGAVVLGGSF
jgi:hypothetical protein